MKLTSVERIGRSQLIPGVRQIRMSEEVARSCVAGDTRAVRRALRRGIDPDTRYGGRTLLNWAAQEGRDAVVALLLACGADANAADSGDC
jgi:hypothetical protein